LRASTFNLDPQENAESGGSHYIRGKPNSLCGGPKITNSMAFSRAA
jgi:hypothetical protein